METFVKILIYIHAFFGGLGLFAGTISIVVRKGGKIHKLWGKIFSVGMLISSLLSLIIACIPNHQSMFLFLIGIFTIYMVSAGNRALTLKASIKSKADWIDKSISYSMFIIAVLMILLGIYSFINNSELWKLYFFFSAFGLLMTYRDFKTFKQFVNDNKIGIISHVGRMVGAFITSVTAFIVAGLSIGSLTFWLLPTLIGVPYITYWTRKIEKTKKRIHGTDIQTS